MTSSDRNLADALAEAARAINRAESMADTLDAIVRATQLSVPSFDHVGISVVHSDGRIETLAATGPLVWEFDSLQYDLDEGPCVEAMRERPVVVAENIRHDQRWPCYAPEAVKAGLRAQMAIQLYTHTETLGALNLYSTASDAIEPGALMAGEAFATHAAMALGHARKESQLTEALASRTVIGQATGILMERDMINHERAFQSLVRTSSTSNIKLRHVAAELVAGADRACAQSCTHERPGVGADPR
jgi:GAF domain-containing protein